LVLQYQFGTPDPGTVSGFVYQFVNGSPTSVTPINSSSGWIGPSGGFALNSNISDLIDLHITFPNSGAFPITFTLFEGTQANHGDAIATWTPEFVVSPTNSDVKSSDINGPYNAGFTKAFTLTAINLSTDKNYPKVVLNLIFPNVSYTVVHSLEYMSPADGNWHVVPSAQNGSDAVWTYGGSGTSALFSTQCPCVKTIQFRINFARPGTYPITLSLDDGKTNYGQNSSYIAVVNGAAPYLTLPDIGNYTYIAGTPLDNQTPVFSVIAINPPTGDTYNQVFLSYTISGGSTADIASMEYFSNGTWYAFTPATQGSTPAVSGTTYFAPPSQMTTLFRVRFVNAKTYTLTFTLHADSVTSTQSVIVVAVTNNFPLFIPLISH
jgi:hypothetical protein